MSLNPSKFLRISNKNELIFKQYDFAFSAVTCLFFFFILFNLFFNGTAISFGDRSYYFNPMYFSVLTVVFIQVLFLSINVLFSRFENTLFRLSLLFLLTLIPKPIPTFTS